MYLRSSPPETSKFDTAHQSTASTTPSCARHAGVFAVLPEPLSGSVPLKKVASPTRGTFSSSESAPTALFAKCTRRFLPRATTTRPVSPPLAWLSGDHAAAYTAVSPAATTPRRRPPGDHDLTAPSSPAVSTHEPSFVQRTLVTAPACASTVLSTRPLRRKKRSVPSEHAAAKAADAASADGGAGEKCIAVTNASRSHTCAERRTRGRRGWEKGKGGGGQRERERRVGSGGEGRRRASRGEARARASSPQGDGPTDLVRDRWRRRVSGNADRASERGRVGAGVEELNGARSCETRRRVSSYLPSRVSVGVPSRDLLIVAARVQLVLGVPSHRGDELGVDVSAALHLEAHGAGRPPRPRDGTRFATPVAKVVSRAEVPRSLAEPRRGRHPRHLVVKIRVCPPR